MLHKFHRTLILAYGKVLAVADLKLATVIYLEEPVIQEGEPALTLIALHNS